MEEGSPMNVEESRLRTFENWPGNAAVEAGRIAAAGFYSTGTNFRVRCFSCGSEVGLTEWEYGDQVMAKHRALNPECEFVIDPERAGNVPLTHSRQPVVPSQSNGRDSVSPRPTGPSVGRWESRSSVYKNEQARLDSFVDWPIPFIVRPEALAASGFYSLRQGDKVQCAFCTGIISRWEPGDVPKEEHRRHFPNCSFVLGLPVGNVPRIPEHSSFDNLFDQGRLNELGIQAHRTPRYPKYSTVESRLRTYTNWPEDFAQQPTDLAQAGFFSSQEEFARDQVRCFHCDGGLRNWEPSDTPWSEHARWFPSCPFLLLVKGKPFVDDVQAQYRTPGDGAAAVQTQRTQMESLSVPRGPSGLSSSMPSLSDVETGAARCSASTDDLPNGPVGLEEENRRLRDARQCKICMDAEIGTVLLPCGHLVACVACAPSLLDCPVCRVTIKATVRTFLT